MNLPEIDQLKAQLAKGDSDAFGQLYDLIGNQLFQTAFRISGSRIESEDAVQVVFANLFRSRQKLKHVKFLRPYLFLSLRRAIGHQIGQRSKVESNLPGDIREQSVSVQEQLEVQDAMSKLPIEQREVVALKIDGGFTFKEIAAMQNESENTVASRYRYALAKLRQLLGGQQ